MDQVAYASLKFFWLFACEAAAFLGLCAYCSVRLREGAWAVVALLGGLIGGLPALMFAYAWARVEWAGDFGPLDTISSNGFLVQADWARPVSLAVLVLAFVISSRGRSGHVSA